MNTTTNTDLLPCPTCYPDSGVRIIESFTCPTCGTLWTPSPHNALERVARAIRDKAQDAIKMVHEEGRVGYMLNEDILAQAAIDAITTNKEVIL